MINARVRTYKAIKDVLQGQIAGISVVAITLKYSKAYLLERISLL